MKGLTAEEHTRKKAVLPYQRATFYFELLLAMSFIMPCLFNMSITIFNHLYHNSGNGCKLPRRDRREITGSGIRAFRSAALFL